MGRDRHVYDGEALTVVDKLENIVYLQLRRNRRPGSIFYYKGKKECDFVVVDKNAVNKVIQVCHTLTEDNLRREIDRVTEAMRELKLDKGLIITMDQTDQFGKVDVLPAWKWLTQGQESSSEKHGNQTEA